MKKSNLIILSFILCSIFLFLTIKLYLQNRSLQIYLNQQSIELTDIIEKLDRLDTVFDFPYKYYRDTLKDVQLLSLENNTIMMSDIVNKERLIYFFDFNKSCQACISETLIKLNQLADEVGPNHIYIISNMESTSDLAILSSKLNNNVTCFRLDAGLRFFNDSMNNQYILLSNKELEIISYLPLSSNRVFNLFHYGYLKRLLMTD